jgi:ABC-type amino acid transport system permease subunit
VRFAKSTFSELSLSGTLRKIGRLSMGATGRSKSTQLLADSATVATASGSQLSVGIAFFAMLFLAVVIAVVYGWHRWGRTVVARPVYRISAENIRTTPTPAWIRSDVRGEIIRDGALEDF